MGLVATAAAAVVSAGSTLFFGMFTLIGHVNPAALKTTKVVPWMAGLTLLSAYFTYKSVEAVNYHLGSRRITLFKAQP